MMRDPKLQLVATLQTARTYHLRSTEPLGGWALCTVNDTTGELLIVSDWGNWAHLWNPKHLGSPSLTHFIADREGYDYLANKLIGSRDARVLDADKTIAKWRKQLCVQRLVEGRIVRAIPYYLSYEDRLDEHLAREIWHRLGSLFDDEQHESIFIEHACQIEGFTRWISSEPWEETEHRNSHEYRVLVDFLLPALAAACRTTIERDLKSAERENSL
jgi:hypothetical protein